MRARPGVPNESTGKGFVSSVYKYREDNINPNSLKAEASPVIMSHTVQKNFLSVEGLAIFVSPYSFFER